MRHNVSTYKPEPSSVGVGTWLRQSGGSRVEVRIGPGLEAFTAGKVSPLSLSRARRPVRDVVVGGDAAGSGHTQSTPHPSRRREVPTTISELTAAVGVGQSAVSQQLRLLRHLGLVDNRWLGRNIAYALYDDHVAQLLDEGRDHAEHFRLGAPDRPADAD